MSEYWKSTPKYWCKHCKTFVRDTKLERQNHDATPKHQGNLKRFLRDLHRGHEKEEKEKERAKSEVARLNGLVFGTGHGESSSSSGFGRRPAPSMLKPQASQGQRKQQLAQLAEMGVSIPDEFRGEMAMAGEWQVTSERIIDPTASENKKLEALGIGVRKRTAPDEEEEVEAAETKKRSWGSTYRSHPNEDDGDLDSLLNDSGVKGKLVSAERKFKEETREGIAGDFNPVPTSTITVKEEHQISSVKREPIDEKVKLQNQPEISPDVDAKQCTDSPAGSVVFKKPKAKNIRQK